MKIKLDSLVVLALYYSMIRKGNNMRLSEIIDNVNEEFSGEEVDCDTFSVPEDGYTLVPLVSVGCWICSYAGSESPVSILTTFPDGMSGDEMNDDNGVHLEDCSDEWWDNLDIDDSNTAYEIEELI